MCNWKAGLLIAYYVGFIILIWSLFFERFWKPLPCLAAFHQPPTLPLSSSSVNLKGNYLPKPKREREKELIATVMCYIHSDFPIILTWGKFIALKYFIYISQNVCMKVCVYTSIFFHPSFTQAMPYCSDRSSKNVFILITMKLQVIQYKDV